MWWGIHRELVRHIPGCMKMDDSNFTKLKESFFLRTTRGEKKKRHVVVRYLKWFIIYPKPLSVQLCLCILGTVVLLTECVKMNAYTKVILASDQLPSFQKEKKNYNCPALFCQTSFLQLIASELICLLDYRSPVHRGFHMSDYLQADL